MSELLLPNLAADDIIEYLSVGDSSITDIHRDNVEDSTATDIVDLIDISRDKKWICYVHYAQDDRSPKNIKITHKRLKAFNHSVPTENVVAVESYENEVKIAMQPDAKVSKLDNYLNLNRYYFLIRRHSKFLSISPDGNYIALSCHTESAEEKKNSSCIIFKIMNNGSIVYYTELKHCNGRAVFLDQQNDVLRLAVINSKRLEIYSKFSKSNKSPNYFYDLSPFGLSSKYSKDNISYQKSFIFDNTSWARIADREEAKKVLTLSRHIRFDVLVTPFVDEGIVRLWSIKDDGVRLTSFSAPNEHVVALSKDLKYAATIIDGVRAVKIYNIKNGLLVYTLHSRFIDEKSLLEVTHVRFCYESRYLALSGLHKTYKKYNKCIKTEIVFEVWYIEAEKSIYGIVLDGGKECDFKTKTVKPFVYKGITDDNKKCLKGIYTFTSEQSENKIYCLELNIDGNPDFINPLTIQWYCPVGANGQVIQPRYIDDYEIENDMNENKYLKCADIIMENKKFYLRFGNRMIQLWILGDPNASNDEDKEDQLIYIRAHRCPSYGIAYSFRDTWVIKEFDSIKLIEGTPAGRMILNIKQDDKNLTVQDKEELKGLYHTDEIFLPLTNNHEDGKTFDYHTFESACQALYYLNWCWEQKNYKSNITSWNESKDENEKIEFQMTLLGLHEKVANKKITEYYRSRKYKKNLHNLFGKTCKIINRAVTRSSHDKSNHFATMAGSRTLAMLASFPQGREIIKLLLKSKDSITFSIFSYTRHIPSYDNKNHNKEGTGSAVMRKTSKRCSWESSGLINYRNSPMVKETIIRKFSPIAENENVLTVLVDELNYDLYELMFNRILSDSKKIGPGCLSALTDVLLFLQEQGNTDLLLTSSQKLSYLAMDINILGVLTSEKGEIIKVNEYDSKIRNLECHSTMEQLRKYDISMLNIYDHLYYKLHMYYTYKLGKKSPWSVVKSNWNKHVKIPFRRIFEASSKSDPKDRTQLCVIPLPYFNTYNILLEDRPKSTENVIYKDTSSFVAIASNQNSNNIFRQGDTVLEVMLQYKWRKFLRIRFIFVCLISAVYYISYCTGVLFALELYDYKSEDEDRSISTAQLVSIICMTVSGSLLLLQELRQFNISRKWTDYFSSGYNWVDIASFTLPSVTLFQLINNWDFFYETCSITTLILWLRIIIRLRVISFVGITLETIIQLSRKVWSILFIFLLVVFAFTHSFIVLLRQREDTYFQETYNGVTSMYSSDTPMNGQIPIVVGNTTLHDISSDNGFADPFKAFYQVWLLIFGVWDPLVNGEAGDDKMVFILCMLFALITVLIFTNMVIALMSSTVDEVKNKGNTVWVSHFASVIAEMEQLWCFANTRRNRNNNPAYIYYTANYSAVKKQEEKLEVETKELRKKVLNIDS